MSPTRSIKCALAALVAAMALPACGGDRADLTVYSGRQEQLVGPLIERYEKQSGHRVDVRYGDSAELAATVLEEGSNTRADVFFSQDAGALGALEKERRLAPLPADLVESVGPRFRSPSGRWVGASGRARVIAFNPGRVKRSELPRSVLNLTDVRWKGRVGWAPTNASFQAFVTAVRVLQGDRAAERWLRAMVANRPKAYENNVAVRDAIANGEIDVGLINHYYVAEARAQRGSSYPVDVYFPPGGDPGSLINVAGAGVLAVSDRQAVARDFVRFLQSREAQEYFAAKTKEYPLSAGVRADPSLVPLGQIRQPGIDLSDLDDTKGTLELIRRSGAL